MKYLLNRFVKIVTLLTLIFNSTLISSWAFAECSTCNLTNIQNFDDWIVSPETNQLCGGFYQEAPYPFPGQKVVVLPDQPATVMATKAELRPEGYSTLRGDIHLTQGNRQLHADSAKILRHESTGELETIEASGNVKILEPGLRLTGSYAKLDVMPDIKRIYDADYRFYERHARGTASKITAFGKDKMILRQATYTTCAPNQNAWELRASKVTLNKITGRGQAKHARMYVKDVPIFYTPYIDFPIDDRRQTGFLFPYIGTSRNSGAEFSIPFYWNIAPNYDATLTPRYLGRRGLEMRGDTRYLTGNSLGEAHVAVLPNDRAYKKFKSSKLSIPAFNVSPQNDPRFKPNYNPYADLRNDPRYQALKRSNSTRRSIFAKHTTSLNPHLAARYHFDAVGDDNYFMDLGNSLNVQNTTQLLQQAELAYHDFYWRGLARVQGFQTLHSFEGPITTNPYRRLPQFSVFNVYPDLPGGLVWTMGGDYTHFGHKKDPWTGNPFTVGDRFQMRPGIGLPMIVSWGFLKPRVQWNVWGYSLNLGPLDRARPIPCSNEKYKFPKNPVVNVPMFDIDTGLIFERHVDVPFTECPYIQTLEPRAYYLWVPYRNQNKLVNFDTSYPGFDYNQLFRENRFSGLDRVGDANQLTLALTTRFLRELTGAERASVTIGQIFYFKERKVTVCNSRLDPLCFKRELPNYQKHRSNYVAQGRYHLQEAWTLNGTMQWDPYVRRYDEGLTWLQYQPNEFNVFNLGYLFLRRNPAQLDPLTGLPAKLNQVDTSFALSITENWRILARYQYDIRFNRTNEILAGLEYQGCCTALRLSVTRFLQPNHYIDQPKKYINGIYLQFVFKGFAGVGHNNLSSMISRSIPGYQWQRDRF